MTPQTRVRGDGGAVLVEFALVLPVLLLLTFGLIEFSLAWRADNRLDSATANASRVAAAGGRNTYADRDALVALLASLPDDLKANLDRVVIYKSTTANGAVPANCVPAVGSTSNVGQSTGTIRCNSYSGNFVRGVTAGTTSGFGGGGSAVDRYWAPSTRLDTILGPPDYIGVYARTVYADKTGTYWADIRLTDSSVFRIQPDFTGF
jgi:Flp pilus assembly protein TadG